ncbi:glycosyl transferase family protein (plasmid) [Aliirhizobium terrae]|uniref:glycosyl transferase family protein n=1 Tax=Terrirhizobium terrae TaxID=2926709 RepID=UPI0025771DDC|nr:glycosyl transferase family protein [Rhizobium sp. CC-CFT758]WJH38735.1 glycosyl transferase family protein [Rhizobium sp. CC-CFT758]
MSRMLGELRDHYGDQILIRTGKAMRPTPFAEDLRLRLRAWANEADMLLDRPLEPPQPVIASHEGKDWRRASLLPRAPLSVTKDEPLTAAPTPIGIAHKLAAIGDNAEPHRRLARHIAHVAPGPGHGRPLTEEEAEDAFGILLRGEADPLQVGAFLIAIQHRSASVAELAGFVAAIRWHVSIALPASLQPELDWPAYLSPKWREPPWFIHAARLVAMAGHRILIHGHFGQGAESGKLEAAAEDAGIPVCLIADDLSDAYTRHNIAFMPLGALSPQVQALLELYPLFEMRTALKNAVNLINPLAAPVTVLGAAQGSRRDLYRNVAGLLKMRELAVVGTNRDFAQVPAGRQTKLMRLVAGCELDTHLPARRLEMSPAPTLMTQREYWNALWSGAVRDQEAEDVVLHTAAAALLALARDAAMPFDDALEQARQLWLQRRR